MRRNFNVKIFIVTFMIVLVFFAAVEIVFFYMPERRDIDGFKQQVTAQIQENVQNIFDWLEGRGQALKQDGQDPAALGGNDGWLFDGTGVLKDQEHISGAVVGIIYTGGESGTAACWNLEAGRENALIYNYITDTHQNSVDGSRWITLDSVSAQALVSALFADPAMAADKETFWSERIPMLCGGGDFAAGSGLFAACLPLSEENEALIAVLDMERAGFMADFNVLLWNGYGYELTRETSLGNIVLSMSGPVAYGRGDCAIELPGTTWYLKVYPLKSAVSVPMLLLEVVIAVLAAALAGVLKCKK